MEEVDQVMQLLKNNKSPGPGEVFTEILKHVGNDLKKAVLDCSKVLGRMRKYQ